MTLVVDRNKVLLQEPEVRYKQCAPVVVMLAVLYVIPGLVSGVMLGLALYAWRGAKESIQSLTVMFIVLNLNAGIYPFWGQGASLRWLVLFSAFGRVFWDGVLSNAKWPFQWSAVLSLYASVVAVLGFLMSRVPAISVFKVVAFFLGAITIVTCFYRTRELKAYWLSWFFSMFLVVLALSLPFYFLPAGFFVNGRGFQGILNHPQTFGPVMAPITAGLTLLLIQRGKRSPILIAAICGGLFSIYASQSRTALLMYVTSLLVAYGFMFFRGQQLKSWKSRPIVSAGFKLIGLVCVSILLVLSGERVVEASEGFLLKKSENEESLSFQVRASMMSRQMENFKAHPLTGIGFGVPSNTDDWISLSTGFLGIPTGFPVEKGFLPSAALEETGIIGAGLLLVLFFCLLGGVFRRGQLPVITIMLACLLANTGEMVFFSFGGSGLYYWLLIGYCYNHVLPCVE